MTNDLQGTWALQARTPVGEASASLSLRIDGALVTGTQTVLDDEVPIQDGQLVGDALSWSVDLRRPFPLTLLFQAKRDGERLIGTARSSRTGVMPFSAERVR